MIALLKDVHLLDGYLQSLPLDSTKRSIDTLYTLLLQQYGLDTASFRENVSYYYADPEKTKEMYEKIEADLKAQERVFVVKDSLRNIEVSDSLRRVERQRVLLDIQQGLRYFHADSSYVFSAERYNEGLYRISGLYHLWQPGWIAYQNRLQEEKTTVVADSVKTATDSVSVKVDSLTKPRKLDTISKLKPPALFKEVSKELKNKPLKVR